MNKPKWGNLGASVSHQGNVEVCIHGETNCPRCALKPAGFAAASLTGADIETCVRKLPILVREIMQRHPEEILLAGGFIRAAIRGEAIRDVDLFVQNVAKARDLAQSYKSLLLHGHTYVKDFESEYAISVFLPDNSIPPVQFIWAFPYATPGDLLEIFDFTITQAAIWLSPGYDWRGMCVAGYYQDLASRRLVYTNPPREDQDIRLIVRTMKFAVLGYRISSENLALVCARALTHGLENAVEDVYRWSKASGPSEVATRELLKKFIAETDMTTRFRTLLHTCAASPSWEEISGQALAEGHSNALARDTSPLMGVKRPYRSAGTHSGDSAVDDDF